MTLLLLCDINGCSMLDGKDPHQESPEIISELKRCVLATNSRQVQCPGLIYKSQDIDKAVKISVFPLYF